MNDRINKLYSLLIDNGYTVQDLGTEDVFRTRMADKENRKQLYDYALSNGHYLGEYDAYEAKFTNPAQSAEKVADTTSLLKDSPYVAQFAEETPEEKAARELKAQERRQRRRDGINSVFAATMPGMVSNEYVQSQMKADAPAEPTEEQKKAAEDERLFKQHLEDSGQIRALYEMRDKARENDGRHGVWSYMNPLDETAPIGGAIHLLRSAFSEDYRDKKAAQKRNRLIAEQADKAIDVYEQATGDRNGVSSLFNAVVDEASRISTWDLGLTDLRNAATLYDLSQKDEGELTAAEKATLDAIGLASSVMSLYGDEVGMGYKIGQGVPATLSFMGSMALNPAAGYGKKLAGDAVKKFGKDYVKRVAKRAAGDILETGAYVGSVALPQVAANALDRINGSTTYELDDDLNVVYGGQESQETLGNAIWKALGETFIEGYTERVGDYFDPIIGFAKGVTKGIKAGKLSDFAEALVDVKPTATMQNIRRFKEKTLFNGTLSELMEEELGMAMNAFTVGDYTFNKEEAEKKGKTYIFDPETQFTTAMSVGMFSAAINGTEMAANHAYKRKVNKTAEEYGKIAERELGAQFSEMIDGVPSLKERIDNADADEKNRIINDIFASPNLSDKQKQAAATYAVYRQYAQTFNAVQANALSHKVDEVQEQHAAYEAGYSSALPVFYNIANAFKEAEQAVSDYTEKTGDSSVADAIQLIENNPAEIKNIRDGLTDEQYQLVTNYMNTLERYKGAYQGRSDKLEDYVDEYAFVLEPAVNKDANGNRTITTAIYKGEPVYVTYNDGTNATIMRFNGEKLGEKTPLLTKFLSEIVSHDAEQYIDDYRQQITGQMNAETENAFEHHPKTQVPQVGLQLQSPEGEVVITAINDNMVEIVPAVYKDGQAQPKEGAEPRTITVDDAYAWQDDYYLSMDADQAYANAMAEASNLSANEAQNEGTPTEEIEQSVSEEVTDGQIAETQPTETESVAPVAPAAPQTARERVPKDDKGNPIYEQTDADTAWDAIVEETEGNVEMAQSVAEQMLAGKKAALEKLQKGKAKAGANVAQIIANEKAHAAAIAQAEAEVAAWEKIAQVNAIRQQKAELERAEAEKAEAEKRRAEEARMLAEQEEQARREREELQGVPDMIDDVPADARARGYRRVNGHKVERQGVLPAAQGKEVGVKFANDVIANGRVAVIEAEQLQPSHLQGQRNPAHFIDEAQPKERNDEASVASARKIAGNIRPEEITSSVTAYTGAPTVNMRGEAIQGNSRSDALRVMWAEHPDQAAKYKQYLIDHAEEFGLNAEEVAAMQHPVLVNMLDVSDTDAISLGQYVAQDTESGGTERIKPKNVARKMGSDIRSYANILLRSSEEDASFAELVDKNGVEVLKWMNTKGYITPTQYASAFDSKGNLTAEAKNDLRGILYQSIFQGGNTQLEEQFNALPAKAQKAILATAYRDYDSPESERMVGEIQSSIRAYYALSHDRAFVDAKNYAEAKEAMLVWSRQYQMDDVTGESFLPSENFSNFALELAVRYKGNTQSATQNLFNELFDLIQGTKEASLFEEADNRPRTLAEAIKETLNIDYNGKNGSDALVGDDTSSQEGRQGSSDDSSSGELPQNNEPTADDRGRTAGDSDTRAEETRGADTATVAESSDEYILNEGESRSIDQSTISQLKNWRRTFQANLAIIDRIEKSGSLTEELIARRKKDTAWLKAVEESLARKEQIKAKNKWGVKSGNHPVPLDTVKLMFAEWNENADIQALFDRVLGTFEKLGVNVTFEDNIGSGTTQGWFAIGENRVKLPTHMIYSDRLGNQSKASVMVHEMIHGVTQYVLWAAKLSENGRNKLGINLSQGMITAAEQLNEIYGIIKNDERFKGQYGLTSVDEMVSELSEPEFRALLKETTVWDKIVEAIRNILGLNTENNALDAASRALDYIIDNYDADLYGKVSELSKKKATANIFDIAEDVLAERELKANHKRIADSFGEFSESDIRYREGEPFYSNAERAVENIKQQKATPEQWLAMIKKDGGLKAGEDKWMGLSDWLTEKKEAGVKSLTKDEVLEFIRANEIQIEEVEYGEGVEDAISDAEDAIRESLQELFDMKVDELRNENPEEIYMSEIYKEAYSRMCAELGYSEDDAPFMNTDATVTLIYDPNSTTDDLIDLSKRLGFLYDNSLNIPKAEQINSTRLDYTTDGLDNKKEIALVVPTIESWNQSDKVHFGDAGEGRAVAWVRFGETTDEEGNRVLVIDEVQSKRHDEGRAKGYQSKEKGDLLAERDRLYDKMYSDGLTEEEFNRRNEINARLEELGDGQIPDAPFDKNYHELVMKRMLRYAAENGFDKVAWTKGAQQAERYNLAKRYDYFEREDNPNEEGRRFVFASHANADVFRVNDEGVVIGASIEEAKGKTLASVVGSELAEQMMSLENGDITDKKDIVVGGEGMKGYYDEMIPRFMNKYVKKWGTKVGEVTLPNVEAAGRTMWSVDVTPEMKESVMQGQPMFREGMGAISDRDVSYENDPIAKFQGKPRYYGKRAAAFAERERRRMENAAKKAAEMLGIEVEIITDASTLQGRKAKAKGWYDIINKKVVVVVPNHVSMGDAVRTVLHEGVAHHGLRELFGDAFDAMLDNIYNNVAPELKARIDAIAERTGVSTQVATEEYLASLAETTNFEEAQRRGWWQQIKRFFVDMLRKLAMPGLNLKEELTDNELRYLLWRSYKNLVDPNSYLKPLGYIDDVAKQKELKVGNYAEKKQPSSVAAEMSEAEEWAEVTMQRIDELEAQAAQLENEISEMEAKREADDASRYDMWEGLMMPLRMQLEDVYAEIEGLYTLSGEEEVGEEEREAEKQRQLYQKRIDNAYLKAAREGDWEEATDLFRQYVLSKAEDEGIVPMDYGVGYRGGAHSSIAKKVKEENPDAIAEAAYQMSIRIPKGSILVPMPSRTGNATYTVKLAEAIAKATDSEVRDVLKGKARMSVYEAKQKGIKMTPEDLGMYTTEELPKGKNIVIIDNVIDKGTTALAAVSAVKGASVVAYAYTLGDKQRAATLKLAEPVTYDDNMRIIPLSQRFNKETDDIRYRMSISEEEFDNTQREAVRSVGIVMPNLGDTEIEIVNVPRHDFTGTGKEAIDKAKEWANSELVGEHTAHEGTDGEFKYNIDEKSVKKFLSGVSTSLSDNLGVHLSVLKKLPSVIDSSIEAEIHADYKKGEKRGADNGVEDKNLLIHRLYGCVRINGELYRVKTTLKERKSAGVRPYTYEVIKIELLNGSSQEGTSSSDASSNSISGAKLLKGVEKSYDKGKLLLDESKKVSESSINSEEIITEVERESAALGVPVRIARSLDELPDEDTRKRAVDGQLKGYFDPRTGEVVLYTPNTDDANDAKRTILHEIVGHKGLRQLIGEEQYDKAMLQLMYMLPADVRDAVLRRAERHGWNAAIAMDEYLAEQAERDVQPTWWGKVNAKIRALLRNMGFNVMLTDADVTYLLWRSRKKLQGDTAFDMATDAILKQAARKSAEAEAWNEQAFKDMEMRDFERNALPSIRHRMGADTNDYERTVRTLGFKQSEAWQDSMRSLLVFQQALAKASGKDISDFENAYMYENRMSSANLMEMEQYRHMVYNPLLKEIHELEQMGASREDIINYLFAKSGLERNEVFARRDAKKHAEGDAAKEQQLYDKYRQKDYAGLTALTRGDAQIAALVDDHSKKKTEYDRLEQNKKRGVAVSDADLKAAKKEMDDARKAMITAIEAEAQRMVDEFERAHNTDNLWNKIRNCTHTTLNISHDAGIMSDEVYGELWNQFQYYIPLRGFAETTAEDVYLYLGGNDSPYNAPIKTAYGRTSLADDPIATIGNMAESAIVEANRNRLKQRFLYMVERHNTDLASISDVWLEYDEVNDEWHTVFAQIPDDATPSEAKRLQQEFEDRMKQLAEQNPGKYANASQQPNIPYRVVKKGDRQEHHVIVKRNGKDVVITINGNPRVAQAINGLTNPEQNQGMITRITSWINRNLSANFTMRNPAFMVSNFVRDGFYTNSMVWVKENPAYAWQYNQNWMKCTAQIASLVSRYKRYEKGDTSALDMNNDMDRMFYEFMINGGETGYTVIKSVEDYKGLISGEMKKMEAGAMGTARRVADKIGDVVDTFGRWAEDTSRFAAYMTSRQLGRTVTKSIWDAKEISVNFNKKGSGNRMMGKFEKGNRLNYVLSNMSQLGRNLYVFWNAGVQGFNNFKKAAKDSPAKFTAMAGTYFTLGVIVAAAFSGDDDEDDYYNLPEYVRRNNICFKIGKGKYATLPLPIEIRAIYGLGELAYSYLSGREGLTHGEAVTKTIQQITQVMPIDMMADGGGAMALVPSAAKPVVEVIRNVDWTGRPIYKEETSWNKNDPTWTLAFKSTDPNLVKLSRLVNEWTNKNTADGQERPYNRGLADNRYLNNPAVWEHIAEGYLGGMATIALQTKKTLMMPFNEDLREVRNVPIVSRFVKDAGKEGRSYAARNEYYEAKNIMDSWRNEMSKAKKEVLDESLTEQQRLNAAKLRSSLEAQYAEAFAKWKELDKQRDNLEKVLNTDISDQAKEEARTALDDVMMQMATLVDAYRD